MKIKENLEDLKKNLEKVEPVYLQAKRNFEEFMAKAEEAEAEVNKYEGVVKALYSAINALSGIDFPETEEPEKEKQPKECKVELKKEETYSKPIQVYEKPVKVSKQRDKKGEVWKFAQNGQVLDKWTSQASAARSLSWDQSSVSRFMKLSHSTQIQKKGFYLDWVG